MNKKQVFVLLSVSLLALGFSIFQYVKEFQAEYADAYSSTKPANGHLWSEMECSSTLCLDTNNNKVGLGTASPTQKLEVVGNVLASGDICNGSGKCLSSVFQTNIIAGTNPTCPSGQTTIMKAYNGTWYTADNASITSWNKVTCGVQTVADGSIMLVNGAHSTLQCTNAGGTVVNDGTWNFCKMSNGNRSCPSGWTQYNNWSQEYNGGAYACCNGGNAWWPTPNQNNCGASCSCTITSGHAWSQSTAEATCGCYPSGCGTSSATATYYTYIGCY